jgi:hypothetical protein
MSKTLIAVEAKGRKEMSEELQESHDLPRWWTVMLEQGEDLRIVGDLASHWEDAEGALIRLYSMGN